MGHWQGSDITEASGMAYCLTGSNRAVVNNDENGPVVLKDLKTGKTVTKVKLSYSVSDPESADINAQGVYHLFDVGDNDENRSSVQLLTCGEIKPGDSGTKKATKYVLKYPGGSSHNAEAGLCHPDGGVYIISKVSSGVIYKLPSSLKTSGTNTMTAVHGPDSDLDFVSEAKFSRDGKWMFVIKKDHNSTVYVWRVSDWTQIDTFSMPSMSKPEAMCVKKDGKGLWVADDAKATGGFYQEVAIPAAYWPAGSGSGTAPPPGPVNPCAA